MSEQLLALVSENPNVRYIAWQDCFYLETPRSGERLYFKLDSIPAVQYRIKFIEKDGGNEWKALSHTFFNDAVTIKITREQHVLLEQFLNQVKKQYIEEQAAIVTQREEALISKWSLKYA